MSTPTDIERAIAAIEVRDGAFGDVVARGRRLRRARRSVVASTVALAAACVTLVALQRPSATGDGVVAEDPTNPAPSASPSTTLVVDTIPGFEPPLTQPNVASPVRAVVDRDGDRILYADGLACSETSEAVRTGAVVTLLRTEKSVEGVCGLGIRFVTFVIGEGEIHGVTTLVVRTVTADKVATERTYDLTAAFACSQRSAGNIDVLPPSDPVDAGRYSQSPREAAESIQRSRAFDARLGDGTLVERSVSKNGAVYVVLDGGALIGRITVRSLGFGAYAATLVQACG